MKKERIKKDTSLKEVKTPKTNAEIESPAVEVEEVLEKKEKFPVGKPFLGPKPEGAAEFVEKVLQIKRVTKVTKGGKKLSFSALVVVGDGKGRVGYGLDKAGEVATAIKKSLTVAKKNMVLITLKGTTIPHEIIGCWGAARVLLKPAVEGTGVIASGAVRAICEGAGIRDILTKCHRSNNPVNVVKATLNGLMRLKVMNRLTSETSHATA
jgi:small subunit ribosomal protein S5